MDIQKTKALARKIYFLTYMLNQFALRICDETHTDESEALEIFSSYLLKLADELHYIFLIENRRAPSPHRRGQV